MEYIIKPRLFLIEQKFWPLSGELNDLSLSELQDIIDSCEDVMTNEGKELYWGWHISSLDMRKEITTLSYNNELQTVIPTIEIYNMLKAYRDKLKDFENEKTNEIGITENEVLDTIKLNDNETPNPDDAIEINESTIKQSDIQEIIDAFQVASGQSYATKNTEKMLLMIEKYNGIEILKADNSIVKVSNAEELSDFILSIDEYVDLKKVNDLKRFFS